MRSHVLIVLSALTFGASSLAEAHIAQTFPAPRTESQKQGPCGLTDSPRGPELVFEPGETITVRWNETVEHPGHYRIAFDIDGEDFPLPNNPDDNFEVTLVDQIADRNVNGADRTYSQEITFPDVECENCTLQLIQIMTTNIPYNSFYFQCSDIALRSGGGGGDAPDAGANGGGGESDAGGDVTQPASGSCSAGGAAGLSMALMLLGALLVLRKRTSLRAVRAPRN